MGSGGISLGYHWRMWQYADSAVLRQQLGTARTVWSSYDGQYWVGGDGGIFRGARYGAFRGRPRSASSPDPWEFSFKPNGSVTGIAEVSTRFCGYNPNRRDCVDVVAVTDAGELLKYDFFADSWTAFVTPQHGRYGLLGLAVVTSGAQRLPWPPPNATVLDVTEGGAGVAAFTAPLKMSAANWRLAGTDVLRLDFSELRQAGRYVVHVPGLGLSDTFVISDAALDFAAYTTARGLYYQRCGFPGGLQEPHASPRHARPQCHEHNSSDDHSHGVNAVFAADVLNSPLYNGEVVDGETTVDMHGGWHDAGDYGKYIMTAAEAIKDLVDGFDLDPSRWTHDDWNLPESGNGVPDLLDEMQWELDWMERMQDSDGGVYHKLTSCNWFFGMPHEETTPRLINPKSTHDTACVAGDRTRYLRIRPHSPLLTSRDRSSARAAISPPPSPPRRERSPHCIPTPRWAEGISRLRSPRGSFCCSILATRSGRACQLVGTVIRQVATPAPIKTLTTTIIGFGLQQNSIERRASDGTPPPTTIPFARPLCPPPPCAYGRYATFVEEWHHGTGPRTLSSDSGAGTGRENLALEAYMYAGHDGRTVDPAIVSAQERNFLRRAKYVLRLAQAQPFSTGDRIDVPGWIGWGKFTYGSRVVIKLLKAWKWTGEQQYRDAAYLAIGPQYGANPLSCVSCARPLDPGRPSCTPCLLTQRSPDRDRAPQDELCHRAW